MAAGWQKQPTGRGPQGYDENGPAATLLVGRAPIQIRSTPRALLAPRFDLNERHVISATGH